MTQTEAQRDRRSDSGRAAAEQQAEAHEAEQTRAVRSQQDYRSGFFRGAVIGVVASIPIWIVIAAIAIWLLR